MSLVLFSALALPAAAQQVPTAPPIVHRWGSLLQPGLPSMTALPLTSEGSRMRRAQPGKPLDHWPIAGVADSTFVVVGQPWWWPLADEAVEPSPAETSTAGEQPENDDRRKLQEEIARLERILAATRRELDRLQGRIDRMTESARYGVMTYEGGETLTSLLSRRDELAALHETNLRRYEQLQRELRLMSADHVPQQQ